MPGHVFYIFDMNFVGTFVYLLKNLPFFTNSTCSMDNVQPKRKKPVKTLSNVKVTEQRNVFWDFFEAHLMNSEKCKQNDLKQI